ncbi:MAG: carbamoyltransferase HypF [Oscillospiraceae bacterium]|nr:carbamoyltransferase HypF [Oscillospiraceae bacterium]
MITRQIRVYGIVQGVGFRPTVSRHAAETGITGSVCNKGPYVEIFAQGEPDQVDRFLDALEHRPPRRAAILKIDVKPAEAPPVFSEFTIIESEKTKGEIFVSPDIAICEDCKRELFDPKDRRYLHPFINCTCCGPRLTILDALPYDRERTSMKAFPMCPACAEEYYSPATRRYDAQPVCCNECGPEVYLIGREERGRAAITYTRQVIASGGIAAIKGIGGFHLCCDAANPAAVERMRNLKHRPMKPFAVMARDLDTARRECETDSAQEDILTGHQKPILLLKRRPGGRICPAVAPDNPKVGVMLPYAPVQLLLFDYDDGIRMPDCLVMTSGNDSGAPICRDDADAVAELGHLCDCILSHDRMIRIRADDSVMDFWEDQPYMIRRSRGYAPLPTLLSRGYRGQVLAMGGELKNTFCLGVNDLFYPSPYVGDLADLRTVTALKETVGRFETLLEAEPTLVACDLHPKYNSTAAAEELGLPVVYVQHHYAHILSCMAENDWSEPVIGVSFDGTGYGTDGTIWGGELLLADLKDFQRLGSIVPFFQAGGDLSAREGWRIACSLIWQAAGDRETALNMIRRLEVCDEQNAAVQVTLAQRRLNGVTSTSAGRLFDGVSAMLGIRLASTFEGEASMALQFAAERAAARGSIPPEPDTDLLREENGFLYMTTDTLAEKLLRRRLDGEDPETLAWRFHDGLAARIAAACAAARDRTGVNTAALSGGVFQNTLLMDLTAARLRKLGFRLLTHRLIPPNDGGIALGQAVYAMEKLNESK